MTTQQKQGNIVAIVVMIFLFAMISFVTNLASPMGDILKHQFGVASWMGTLGVFANFIAYAVMGYPAGILLQKHGYKKTALIAIAVGFIGVGIQTLSGTFGSSGFGVYLLGAFVAGFSMCMLNTVVNPMLKKLGRASKQGTEEEKEKRANQLINTGGAFNSLSGTAVIILSGILIPNGIKNAVIGDVFPLMFAALAIFAFAFAIILFAAIPENERQAKANEDKSQYSPLSFRHFVLGAVGIFVYVGIEVGIPNVLQKWLQNPDLDVLKLGGSESVETIAGSIAATYWFLMFIGRFIGAAIGSKVSAKAMLGVASTLGLVLTIVAMFTPSTLIDLPVFNKGVNSLTNIFTMAGVPINAAFLVLIGLCTSVMWGGIFNLAVQGLGKYTEKASGIFMIMVCGGGILPLLQNGIVDMTGGIGYLTSYWVVIAGLAYLLFYTLVGSKNVNTNIDVN